MFGSEGTWWTVLRPAFKPLVIYLLAALLWSLFGLLSPTTPLHYKEYSLPVLAIEVGGHISFGFLAADDRVRCAERDQRRAPNQ